MRRLANDGGSFEPSKLRGHLFSTSSSFGTIFADFARASSQRGQAIVLEECVNSVQRSDADAALRRAHAVGRIYAKQENVGAVDDDAEAVVRNAGEVQSGRSRRLWVEDSRLMTGRLDGASSPDRGSEIPVALAK